MKPPTIDDAIELADNYHRGQVDKGGVPYIEHPLAVMEAFTDETLRIIALLHDIIEDTPMTLDRLRDYGYSKEVVDAIDAISRREGETYRAYIDRLAKNPLAVKVKIADLKHNMSPERFMGYRPTLMRRYKETLERLTV